jgi:hypothetical protein
MLVPIPAKGIQTTAADLSLLLRVSPKWFHHFDWIKSNLKPWEKVKDQLDAKEVYFIWTIFEEVTAAYAIHAVASCCI